MTARGGEAVVLCGGLGTRLRGHDAGRPKALVPVGGRPFLAWQLDWLRRLGVGRAILAAGFRADQIEDWLRDTGPQPVDVLVVTEPRALGTAGAVRHLLGQVRSAGFFVTNGDTLLPGLHLEGALATPAAPAVVAAVAAETFHTGDRLRLDGDRVTALERRATDGPAWKNGGFYSLRRDDVEAWPEGARSLERDVFPHLAARGELLAQRTPPPLLDMGTPEGRREMHDFLLTGRSA
ncbi:MAG: NTP transferase domain-containing protein [Holophagales bacterium]|nr:NTP transferase domain-containing protein [Holophagales bacterium]